MARKKAKKKKMGFQGQILALFGLITAVVFMPTTIMLVFAMLPTIIATVVDRTGKGTKGLTVGAMNLAGTTPFLIDLWTKGNDAPTALEIITDPRTIIVVYASAGIGYLINWAIVGIVGTLMVQRGGARLKDIKKKQEALIERWGAEVTGEIPLDPYGFPLESPDKMLPEPGAAKTDGKKTNK